MSQCGGLKPNPAHGRWWVGSNSRSQHDVGRLSLGFESWWPRRGPRSGSSAVEREKRAYGGFACPQRERAIAMTISRAGRTQGHVGSAASHSYRHSYRRFSLEVCKTYPARAPLGGRRSRVGALGEATSSQNQVMTYPCYVRISKPSPPTIYHGQGLV